MTTNTNTDRQRAEELLRRLSGYGDFMYSRDIRLVEEALASVKDDGVGLIAAERKRQVSQEGWSRSHDDKHYGGDLARAALCYAAPVGHPAREGTFMPKWWPWEARWWKPTPDNRIRELVKAGALIAAEIDRLQHDALSSPRQELKP